MNERAQALLILVGIFAALDVLWVLQPWHLGPLMAALQELVLLVQL
jgi:hypothetical protein